MINVNKISKIDFPFPERKFIRAEELIAKGFTYYMIKRMAEDNIIKKINGNTYENLDYKKDESDYLYVSGYINEGVVCLMSAAVYHGISNFRISQIDVAIKQKAKVSILPKWPVIGLYYFSNKRYEIGVQTVSIDGGEFKVYDIEKTVCDLLSYRNKYGLEDSLAVLKSYLNRDKRDLNKLVMYSKKLRCYNVLSKYLEVLL